MPWTYADVHAKVGDLRGDGPVERRRSAALVAQDELLVDATRRLGVATPGSAMPTEAELRLPHMVTGRYTGDWIRRVPIGTRVALEEGDERWTIVGSRADRIELARWDEATGATRRAVRSWSDVLVRNPTLVEGYSDAWMNLWKADVHADGLLPTRSTPVTMTFESWDGLRRNSDQVFPATWGDLLAASGIERMRPIVSLPDTHMGVVHLREALGDRHFVVSQLGESGMYDPRVIGTDTLPGLGAETLEDAAATQRWFRERAGLDVWAAHQRAIHTVDIPSFTENAAAGLFGGRAHTYVGPTTPELRDAIAERDMRNSGASWEARRGMSDLIARHHTTIATHEGGHIANARAWGVHYERATFAADKVAMVEQALVDEVTGDLFGVSRTGERDFGIRDVARRKHAWSSLGLLREQWRTTPLERIDVHHGTQLLTAPPAALLQRRNGGDLLAEVTGAAVRSVARREHPGSMVVIDVPNMAEALVDATKQRIGAHAPEVEHMQRAWRVAGALR